MRLLRCTLSASICILVAAYSTPLLADSNGCSKDVILYFDVSRSMYTDQDGTSAVQLFALAVEGLLRREDFVQPGDHITVVAFAKTVAEVIDTTDANGAATAVRGLYLATSPPWAVGDTNRTDLKAVLTDYLSRIDTQREQIFIIASDFADDPEPGSCKPANARIFGFRAAAERTRAALPAKQPVRLALLTTAVMDERCAGDDQKVSDAVRTTFKEVIGARGEVEITPAKNEIANSLRQTVADPIRLEKALLPSSVPYQIAVTAHNPNPFPVTVISLNLSSAKQVQPHKVPQERIIGCKQSEILTAAIPDAMRGELHLDAELEATTPPAKPLKIPSARITITPPEVHVFENITADTYAVELVIESAETDEVTLVVSGGPEAKDRSYKIDTSRDRTRVALTFAGKSNAASGMTVRAIGGNLFVKTDAEIKEVSAVAAERSLDRAGDRVPSVMRWAVLWSAVFMILSAMKIVPGGPRRWWKLLLDTKDVHEISDLVARIVRYSGLSSMVFPYVWPYGVISRAPLENFLWAFAAGGATLFVFRWFVVIVFWRILERRLMETSRAIALRRFLTVVAVGTTIVVGCVVFALLSAALSDSNFVRAEIVR